MIAGLIQQALGGVLLRARMEARKAAFAAAAGLLVFGALGLASVAGLVVLAGRYGLITALLVGAGAMLTLAVLVFLVGRRVPGADASASAVRAEAVMEDVPAPGMSPPPAGAQGGGDNGADQSPGFAALVQLHDTVRGSLDGVMPPGGQGAMAAIAANQLARRPAVTLGAAVAAGAAFGLIQHRRRGVVGDRAPEVATPRDDDPAAAAASINEAAPEVPRNVADARAAATMPSRPRRPVPRTAKRTTTREPTATVRVHDR